MPVSLGMFDLWIMHALVACTEKVLLSYMRLALSSMTHSHGVEATFVWISIVESLGASNHDRGIRGAIEGHNLPSGQVGPAEDCSGPTDEPGSAARGALDHAR